MGICYIVGAGELTDILPDPGAEDMVIACDGGYRACLERGIKTDLVVGDFDSLGYVPEHPHTVKLNSQKDETDTAWAVQEGWKRGYRKFWLYGCLGGRLSHTMANIQLLAGLASKGGEGLLLGSGSWLRILKDGEISFDAAMKGYLSVFCLGERAEGVYEEGLKYSLTDATLTGENALGVSNEFTGKESRISVRRGTLLLIGEEIKGRQVL